MSTSASNLVGPEARYLTRFKKLGQLSGTTIKNIDSAQNVTEHLKLARASLAAQESNVRTLFGTAQEMVTGIDTLQQMLGHTFVRNMPLPSKEISESTAKQLGYVQLTMRFLQAGVVHFMEEMSTATDRIEQLESLVGGIAEYDDKVDLIGEMHSLDLESLEETKQTKPVNSIETSTEASVTTPPLTPPQDVVKSSSKDSKKQTKKAR